MSRFARAIGLVLMVLAVATIYEALVALRLIDLGTLPGEGPPGEAAVLLTTLLAMVALAGLVLFARRRSPAWAPAPAAAAFMVARFFTFDPYYLPTLRRMSDHGLVSSALVFAVTALALCAAALTYIRPRAGGLLAAPVVLACAFLAFVMDGGH